VTRPGPVRLPNIKEPTEEDLCISLA
jgi:hypothetical protein